MKTILISGVACALLFSCKKSSNVSTTPDIQFVSIKPTIVHATDTLLILFRVNDGDGDLGATDFGRVYVKDTKSSAFRIMPFPDEPKDIQNSTSGIHALYTLQLPASQLSVTNDSLSLEVYVRDNAGHESNHIQTPKVYIN